MSRPQTPYEALSYELNQFRERRMAERRASPRAGIDRRAVDPQVDTDADTEATRQEWTRPMLVLPPVTE